MLRKVFNYLQIGNFLPYIATIFMINFVIADEFNTEGPYGILYFDTEIIQEETKNEIISIVDRFPISLTNEQGIMNLYFIFIKNQYKELTKEIGDAITYYYWLIPGKKIIITKQLKEKYK